MGEISDIPLKKPGRISVGEGGGGRSVKGPKGLIFLYLSSKKALRSKQGKILAAWNFAFRIRPMKA